MKTNCKNMEKDKSKNDEEMPESAGFLKCPQEQPDCSGISSDMTTDLYNFTDDDEQNQALKRPEKERKDRIKNDIQEIRRLLPPPCTSEKKQTHHDLLQNAITFIRLLVAQNKKLMTNLDVVNGMQNDCIQKENKELKLKSDRYRNIFEMFGIPEDVDLSLLEISWKLCDAPKSSETTVDHVQTNYVTDGQHMEASSAIIIESEQIKNEDDRSGISVEKQNLEEHEETINPVLQQDCSVFSDIFQGTNHHCVTVQGISQEFDIIERSNRESITVQKTSHDSVIAHGSSLDSVTEQGTSIHSVTLQGTNHNSVAAQGTRHDSVMVQGTSLNSDTLQGTNHNFVTVQGTSHDSLFVQVACQDSVSASTGLLSDVEIMIEVSNSGMSTFTKSENNTVIFVSPVSDADAMEDAPAVTCLPLSHTNGHLSDISEAGSDTEANDGPLLTTVQRMTLDTTRTNFMNAEQRKCLNYVHMVSMNGQSVDLQGQKIALNGQTGVTLTDCPDDIQRYFDMSSQPFNFAGHINSCLDSGTTMNLNCPLQFPVGSAQPISPASITDTGQMKSVMVLSNGQLVLVNPQQNDCTSTINHSSEVNLLPMLPNAMGIGMNQTRSLEHNMTLNQQQQQQQTGIYHPTNFNLSGINSGFSLSGQGITMPTISTGNTLFVNPPVQYGVTPAQSMTFMQGAQPGNVLPLLQTSCPVNQLTIGPNPQAMTVKQGPVALNALSQQQQNQHPSALILPNGQIVPVVTQPNLLFPQQQCTPVNGGLLMPSVQAAAGLNIINNLSNTPTQLCYGSNLLPTSTVQTTQVMGSLCPQATYGLLQNSNQSQQFQLMGNSLQSINNLNKGILLNGGTQRRQKANIATNLNTLNMSHNNVGQQLTFLPNSCINTLPSQEISTSNMFGLSGSGCTTVSTTTAKQNSFGTRAKMSTLTAVWTPEGSIILTIPECKNNGETKSQKATQRTLMPKPTSISRQSFFSVAPVTTTFSSSPFNPIQSNIISCDFSSSNVAAVAMSSSSSSSATMLPLTVNTTNNFSPSAPESTTDILAKAAKSIFSISPNECLSPTCLNENLLTFSFVSDMSDKIKMSDDRSQVQSKSKHSKQKLKTRKKKRVKTDLCHTNVTSTTNIPDNVTEIYDAVVTQGIKDDHEMIDRLTNDEDDRLTNDEDTDINDFSDLIRIEPMTPLTLKCKSTNDDDENEVKRQETIGDVIDFEVIEEDSKEKSAFESTSDSGIVDINSGLSDYEIFISKGDQDKNSCLVSIMSCDTSHDSHLKNHLTQDNYINTTKEFNSSEFISRGMLISCSDSLSMNNSITTSCRKVGTSTERKRKKNKKLKLRVSSSNKHIKREEMEKFNHGKPFTNVESENGEKVFVVDSSMINNVVLSNRQPSSVNNDLKVNEIDESNGRIELLLSNDCDCNELSLKENYKEKETEKLEESSQTLMTPREIIGRRLKSKSRKKSHRLSNNADELPETLIFMESELMDVVDKVENMIMSDKRETNKRLHDHKKPKKQTRNDDFITSVKKTKKGFNKSISYSIEASKEIYDSFSGQLCNELLRPYTDENSSKDRISSLSNFIPDIEMEGELGFEMTNIFSSKTTDVRPEKSDHPVEFLSKSMSTETKSLELHENNHRLSSVIEYQTINSSNEDTRETSDEKCNFEFSSLPKTGISSDDEKIDLLSSKFFEENFADNSVTSVAATDVNHSFSTANSIPSQARHSGIVSLAKQVAPSKHHSSVSIASKHIALKNAARISQVNVKAEPDQISRSASKVSEKSITLEPCSSVTLEPYSSVTLEPRSGDTLEPCSGDTLELCSSVTLEPCSSVTLEPYSSVTLEPRSGGDTLELCSSVTLEPCSSVTLEPCSSVTLEPCSSVTLDPCSSVTLEPCSGDRTFTNTDDCYEVTSKEVGHDFTFELNTKENINCNNVLNENETDIVSTGFDWVMDDENEPQNSSTGLDILSPNDIQTDKPFECQMDVIDTVCPIFSFDDSNPSVITHIPSPQTLPTSIDSNVSSNSSYRNTISPFISLSPCSSNLNRTMTSCSSNHNKTVLSCSSSHNCSIPSCSSIFHTNDTKNVIIDHFLVSGCTTSNLLSPPSLELSPIKTSACISNIPTNSVSNDYKSCISDRAPTSNNVLSICTTSVVVSLCHSLSSVGTTSSYQMKSSSEKSSHSVAIPNMNHLTVSMEPNIINKGMKMSTTSSSSLRSPCSQASSSDCRNMRRSTRDAVLSSGMYRSSSAIDRTDRPSCSKDSSLRGEKIGMNSDFLGAGTSSCAMQDKSLDAFHYSSSPYVLNSSRDCGHVGDNPVHNLSTVYPPMLTNTNCDYNASSSFARYSWYFSPPSSFRHDLNLDISSHHQQRMSPNHSLPSCSIDKNSLSKVVSIDQDGTKSCQARQIDRYDRFTTSIQSHQSHFGSHFIEPSTPSAAQGLLSHDKDVTSQGSQRLPTITSRCRSVNRSPATSSERTSSFAPHGVYNGMNGPTAMISSLSSPPLHHHTPTSDHRCSSQQLGYELPSFHHPSSLHPFSSNMSGISFEPPPLNPPPLNYSRDCANTTASPQQQGHVKKNSTKKTDSHSTNTNSKLMLNQTKQQQQTMTQQQHHHQQQQNLLQTTSKSLNSNSSRSSRASKKMLKSSSACDVDSNVFESQSLTPYFGLRSMSPNMNLATEGLTYFTPNFLSNSGRPLKNVAAKTLHHHDSTPMTNPFNSSLFSSSRNQNGLGLNFQRGFGIDHMHPGHMTSSQMIIPHSGAHMHGFGFFPDIGGSMVQRDSLNNISSMKFGHSTILPSQGTIEPSPLHHPQTGSSTYNNRGQLPSHMLHEPLNFNALIGHQQHTAFDARSINGGLMHTPFGGHNHAASFGLNFPVHNL